MKYSDHQRVNKIYEYASKLNQYICENRWCRDLQDHNSTKANRNQTKATCEKSAGGFLLSVYGIIVLYIKA